MHHLRITFRDGNIIIKFNEKHLRLFNSNTSSDTIGTKNIQWLMETASSSFIKVTSSTCVFRIWKIISKIRDKNHQVSGKFDVMDLNED